MNADFYFYYYYIDQVIMQHTSRSPDIGQMAVQRSTNERNLTAAILSLSNSLSMDVRC